MTSLVSFHLLTLTTRLGPENGPRLQGKEDDCSVIIPYTLVASPQGSRKTSCHVDPASIGCWSRMMGQRRNLRRGRSSHGRSLHGISCNRPSSRGTTGHQLAPPQHLRRISEQMARDHATASALAHGCSALTATCPHGDHVAAPETQRKWFICSSHA